MKPDIVIKTSPAPYPAETGSTVTTVHLGPYPSKVLNLALKLLAAMADQRVGTDSPRDEEEKG